MQLWVNSGQEAYASGSVEEVEALTDTIRKLTNIANAYDSNTQYTVNLTYEITLWE